MKLPSGKLPHTFLLGMPCPGCGTTDGCHEKQVVFVFASNRAGRHGRGSALHARRFYGAMQGIGEGRMGSAYAIPTKDEYLKPLSLLQIKAHVAKFLAYATEHPDVTFQVVAIGCGLAGYNPEHIAPMFVDAPTHVQLPYEFLTALDRMKNLEP
jgi:hypothetical protein